eukprot:583327-Hanusia_phi.AAC.2
MNTWARVSGTVTALFHVSQVIIKSGPGQHTEPYRGTLAPGSPTVPEGPGGSVQLNRVSLPLESPGWPGAASDPTGCRPGPGPAGTPGAAV